MPIVEYTTYDVLVERSSVQPGNERLDCKEGGQDPSERSDKSKNNGDACRHACHSMKVFLERRTIIPSVIVTKLLDPESTISSPPDGNLALDDLPVLHESGGP